MGAISFNNKLYPTGGTPSASMSVYDNSDSGLDATNVQDAVDEVVSDFDQLRCNSINPSAFGALVLNSENSSSESNEGSQISFKGKGGNTGNSVNIDAWGNVFRIFSKFNGNDIVIHNFDQTGYTSAGDVKTSSNVSLNNVSTELAKRGIFGIKALNIGRGNDHNVIDFVKNDNSFYRFVIWDDGTIALQNVASDQITTSSWPYVHRPNSYGAVISLPSFMSSSEPQNCFMLDRGDEIVISLSGVVSSSGGAVYTLPRTARTRVLQRMTVDASHEIFYIDINSKILMLTGAITTHEYFTMVIPVYSDH